MALIKRKDLVEQDILKDFRKQVQLLTKDLVALQKQSRAVNKTGTGSEAKERIVLAKKLRTTTKQVVAVTKEEAEAVAILKVKQQERNKLLKQEARNRLGLISAYDKQAQKLIKLRKQYKDLAIQNKQNTAEGRKMLAGLQKLDRQLKKVDASVGQSQRKVGSYGKAIGGIAKQMLMAGGIIGALMAFGRVLKGAFNIYKEFAKESSRLAAILGKSKDEIKLLTEQAKLLGATTAFTAKEVIQLQTELAKLGFSLKEIENSTPGILDLAAATGHDLAGAAELAGATLRIFNLDASEMSRVTDVLALSTTKSSLSMEKLATALPIVGKTAQIAGLTLEETTALLGTLTDRGIDASSAGTSLRNIFLELSKKGISYNDAMEKINNSTDKNKTSMELFGKRAGSAGVVLSETAESAEKLRIALDDANGSAKIMAKTMLDNLAGDMTKAQSAWEGFVHSVLTGEGTFSKVFRSITKASTNFLGVITDLNNGMTLFDIRAKKSSVLTKGLEKDTKKWIDQKKKLNTIEERTNYINSTSAQIKQKLRGNIYALAKAEEALAKLVKENTPFWTKETKAVKAQIKQLKFNNIAYNEKIEILKTLVPLKKENVDITEDEATATESTLTPLDEKIKLLKEEEKILKQKIELDDLLKAKRGRDTGLVAEIETKSAPELVLSEKQKLADDIALIEDNARAEKKRKEDEEWEETKKRAAEEAEAVEAIKEAAWQAGTKILLDISAAFFEERQAQIQADADKAKTVAQGEADTKIQVLQEQLDKGLINEEQFATQSAVINEQLAIKVADIERKQRIESAKADKKKALFDIGIATIVASIKALPNLIASAAILAIGAIQAAAVAAKPIPKFAKGEVNIKGRSHEQGGMLAEIEGGESYINKAATADSTDILNMVNKGLLTDKNFKQMSQQDNNLLLASLLISGNNVNKQMLTALLNGKNQIIRSDGLSYVYGNDGSTEIFKIPD